MPTGGITHGSTAAPIPDIEAFEERAAIAEFDGGLTRLQPVENSLDAALSFLAWKQMKAIVELEADFSVSMDHFHSAKAPEFFGTSESSMALMNFSVMSQ